MEYFPWISFVVSLAVLLIQALARYGVSKQEEVVEKRFQEVEKDLREVDNCHKTIDHQQTSMLVTLESIKTKQEAELATRKRQDTIADEMKGQMVSKELFEARMGAIDTSLSNLATSQNDVLGKFVEWLKENKPIKR